VAECNTSLELFHPGKKKVVVDFSGGDLSSDGGIAVSKRIAELLNS